MDKDCTSSLACLSVACSSNHRLQQAQLMLGQGSLQRGAHGYRLSRQRVGSFTCPIVESGFAMEPGHGGDSIVIATFECAL